jgi:hypothetical protein
LYRIALPSAVPPATRFFFGLAADDGAAAAAASGCFSVGACSLLVRAGASALSSLTCPLNRLISLRFLRLILNYFDTVYY